MSEFKVGVFEVSVTQPSPSWITIINTKHNTEQMIRLSHRDLADLKYAIEKAMHEASLKGKGMDKEIYVQR